MATNTNTIKTRIKLKSDTEQKWRETVLTTDHPLGLKASGTSFVPLQGEIIIYSPDNEHTYSRLKIGTGKPADNVLALPFVDAGTLSGKDIEIVKLATRNDFPNNGSTYKLYIDLSTKKIYHYDNSTYTELVPFTFSVSKNLIGSVINFLPGVLTTAKIENNILTIDQGSLPELSWEDRLVVTDVTKG